MKLRLIPIKFSCDDSLNPSKSKALSPPKPKDGDDVVDANIECDNKSRITEINDDMARRCEAIFKALDPTAMILPVIGLPSQNNGICTIMHKMPNTLPLKINGLSVKSSLANSAFFSTEISDGQPVNLYEIMLPEKPSIYTGKPSGAEKYVAELHRAGINVAGTHWHWWDTDPYVAAIHHQSIGMDPRDFALKTVNALRNYIASQ